MKAIFVFFGFVGEVLIFLAGFALLALVITVIGKVFSFVATNIKSILIALLIIYASVLISLQCAPFKKTFFYDLSNFCSKQSNS